MARRLQNFVLSYAEQIDQFTEAPTAYCLWAAVSVLGAVLKNNVFKKRGVYTIYPNQYVILTGPPGIGKGEAIHPIYNIIKRLKLVNAITDRVTAPKIIESIATGFGIAGMKTPPGGVPLPNMDHSAVLFSTELQSLLTASDWMLQFLCDAWDRNEYEYGTKNNGSSVISGMCTSLIGSCVPDYIRSLNKDSVASINSGFTARAVFVYAEKPSKRLPEPPEIEKSPKGIRLLSDLEHDIIEISQMKGEFSFDPAAQLLWNKFYNNIDIEETDSDVVSHFKRRLPIHVMKLSMIFSASHSNNLIVAREDLLNAIKCLADVQDNLDKAFRGVGESELSEASSRIQSFIERKGLTTRKELLKVMHRHVTLEDMERILFILNEIGIIEYAVINKASYIKHKKNSSKPVSNTSIKDLTL